MDYNNFINKQRDIQKFDDEKTKERLLKAEKEKLSETASSPEQVVEEKNEKGSI